MGGFIDARVMGGVVGVLVQHGVAFDLSLLGVRTAARGSCRRECGALAASYHLKGWAQARERSPPCYVRAAADPNTHPSLLLWRQRGARPPG